MKDPRLDTLREYVRETRKRKNLNQQKIRERGGPSSGWIGELEAGNMETMPKIETLKKLALGLAEPIEDVLTAAGLGGAMQRNWGVAYAFRDWVRAYGFPATLDRIRTQPATHEKLTNFLLNEELTADETQVKPFDDLHTIIRMAMDIVDGRRPEVLSKDEQRVLKLATWPMPTMRLLPVEDLKDNEIPDWLFGVDDFKEFLHFEYFVEDHVTSVDVVLRIQGAALAAFGFHDSDLLFLKTGFNDSDQTDKEVMLLVDGRPAVGICRNDRFGQYVEFSPSTGMPWRVPLSGDETFIAALVKSTLKYSWRDSNDLPF